MTPLEQKLQQLNLKAMSREAEAPLAEAAGQECCDLIFADMSAALSATYCFS
jgi:hypothetical protein